MLRLKASKAQSFLMYALYTTYSVLLSAKLDRDCDQIQATSHFKQIMMILMMIIILVMIMQKSFKLLKD